MKSKIVVHPNITVHYQQELFKHDYFLLYHKEGDKVLYNACYTLDGLAELEECTVCPASIKSRLNANIKHNGKYKDLWDLITRPKLYARRKATVKIPEINIDFLFPVGSMSRGLRL